MNSELATAIAKQFDGAQVHDLRRLSGGASQETWSLDIEASGGTIPAILRRAPGGAQSAAGTHIGLDTEAKLIALAHENTVPTPEVLYTLQQSDGLGAGFLMNRIDGETIARKILRDDEYANARPVLAEQCGAAAAGIHAIAADTLPDLPLLGAREQFQQYRDMYDNYDHPHPVFEYAFRWLEERMPEPADPVLVHGDFRNGNIIVGSDGLRAVLDWELAHLGDPMEDLGWICVNSWRFGNIEQPVGGFGSYDQLFEGYANGGGGEVDADRVKYWEVFGSLKWGIMCMTMYFVFNSGMDPSVERAAIGRRSSEAEIDLLRLIAQ